MPTKKTKILFVLGSGLLSCIERFRSERQIRTRSEAIRFLIEEGLRQSEIRESSVDDVSLEPQKEAPIAEEQPVSLCDEYIKAVNDFSRGEIAEESFSKIAEEYRESIRIK